MEHVKVTDEWLYKCMPIVDAAIIQELERQTDINYEFSPKFGRKMKRLIKKEAHPWMGIFYTVSKRVAIFFICLLGATLAVVMSVEAYRNKFFETIKIFLGDAYELRYETDEEIKEIENYYEPHYIPEGYKITEREESAIALWCIYEDVNGNVVIWDQSLVMEGSFAVYDSEYDDELTRNVNGKAVTFYLYDSGYKLAYYEQEYYAYTITADNLSIEEICKIIESVS